MTSKEQKVQVISGTLTATYFNQYWVTFAWLFSASCKIALSGNVLMSLEKGFQCLCDSSPQSVKDHDDTQRLAALINNHAKRDMPYAGMNVIRWQRYQQLEALIREIISEFQSRGAEFDMGIRCMAILASQIRTQIVFDRADQDLCAIVDKFYQDCEEARLMSFFEYRNKVAKFESRKFPFVPESYTLNRQVNAKSPVWPLTPLEFKYVPDGTAVFNAFSEHDSYIKGQDYIDQDTRCGYMAYGLSVTV